MTRRSGQGFTLVEVLAAVAILGIVMGAVLSSMARYADNSSYLRERTIAMWVAHNRLTEIRLEPAFPETGESDGDMEMAGREWRWFIEVTETQDPALRRVDIRVQRVDGESDLATLAAFIGDPNPQPFPS